MAMLLVSCSLPIFLDDCLSPIIFHVHTAQNGINDFTLYTSIACWNELDATFKGVLLEGEAGSKRDTDALCPYTLSVLNSYKSWHSFAAIESILNQQNNDT